MSAAPKTVKAHETRARILDIALALFREKGFDHATMRDIAHRAEVATGAAYYYFPSKEHLVMEFYVRTQDEIERLVEGPLARTRDLEERLRDVFALKFDRLRPNRTLLTALLRVGIDPGHPLSPFSPETQAVRERSIDLFRRVLEGVDLKLPQDVAPYLPRLLWLYYMGLILFWLHDRSEGQSRTERLRARSLEWIVTAIRLSRFRVLAPLRRATLRLVAEVEGSA